MLNPSKFNDDNPGFDIEVGARWSSGTRKTIDPWGTPFLEDEELETMFFDKILGALDGEMVDNAVVMESTEGYERQLVIIDSLRREVLSKDYTRATLSMTHAIRNIRSTGAMKFEGSVAFSEPSRMKTARIHDFAIITMKPNVVMDWNALSMHITMPPEEMLDRLSNAFVSTKLLLSM